MQLRKYQSEAIESIHKWYADGNTTNPLLVMATGVGKSIVIAKFIEQTINEYPDQRIICAIDTKELVQQNYEKLLEINPFFPCGVYSSGLRRRDVRPPVIFAGIQSVADKAFKFGKRDILIIDECHGVSRNEKTRWNVFIRDLLIANPDLIIIGLTATPYRLDSGMLHEGQDALFGGVAYEYGLKEAISDGYLTELVSKPTKTKIKVEGVGKRGGDFIESQLQKAVNIDEITEAAVLEIIEKGQDRNSWLIFAAGIEHAEAVRDKIRSFDIDCEMITGKTPNAERDKIIEDSKAGRIRCLVNVAVLTKGFDNPRIDLIASLRPTESAVLWSQCVGRGLRLLNGAIGNLPTAEERKEAIAKSKKPDCLLLDFAGNVMRFGYVDEIEYGGNVYSGESDGSGEAPVKECPECNEYVAAGFTLCPHCAYEFPPPELRIDRSSHKGAVLSHQAEPEDHKIIMMTCVPHGGFGDKPKTMRVDYMTESLQKFSEWVCFQHKGYARQKAVDWWRDNADGDKCKDMTEVQEFLKGAPDTIDGALKFKHTFKAPAAIRVKKDGKYWKILAKSFEEIESPQVEEEEPESEDDLMEMFTV
tara:strand:- start:776 stop:2539 length:1764 start_codon:yes stop_codon:yes gene_type:complete